MQMWSAVKNALAGRAVKTHNDKAPTLLVFNNGEVVDQIVGAVPKPVIKQKLDSVLS